LKLEAPFILVLQLKAGSSPCQFKPLSDVRMSCCEKFRDENATTPILTPYNIRIT
jgi:hypothetical protein